MEGDADICWLMAWVQWQQLRGFARNVAVVVCPPTQWTNDAKNAKEGVSQAVAQVGLMMGRRLAVEAMVAADIWSCAAGTSKGRRGRIDNW